jgi:hypothetical protein
MRQRAFIDMTDGIRQRIEFSSYIRNNIMTKDQIIESQRSISRLQPSQDTSPLKIE